ncbi:unnamed protein product [Cuscuta campestris]|uniref:Uncharacterized protein n=1 Tax=Cuscuta campestris TaxID=132261 RepID=A0A484K6N9_9ASTE|nr:unnamed protein product [Cuscuta campestris]
MEGSKPVLLPLSDRTARSYSFQDRNKESITLFHTATDASSEVSQSDIAEAWISSDDDDVREGDDEYEASPSSSGSGSFDGIEESAPVARQCVLTRRMRSLSSSS